MRRRQRAPAGRPQLTEGGNHSTRRGFRPGGWHTQDRNHPRRSPGANARRLPSLLRTNRQAERRKAQPLPRTGPALRLRSSRNAPLGSISQHRRSSTGRDSLQRRILHPWHLPSASSGCAGALVRQAPLALRKSRPGSRRIRRRSLLRVCPQHRGRTAGPRWTAARLLHRDSLGRRYAPDPVPSPARNRRGLDAGDRSRGPATGSQQGGELPLVQLAQPHRGQTRRHRGIPNLRPGIEPSHPCPAERRNPLRQESGRAHDPGEAGCKADGSGNARNLGRFESERAPLAFAVRTSQSRQDRGAHQTGRCNQRRVANQRAPTAEINLRPEPNCRARRVTQQAGASPGARQELVAAGNHPGVIGPVPRTG